MASRLLDSTTTTFSDIELTQYVNEQRGTNFSDIVEAVGNLGIAAVGISLLGPMAIKIAGLLSVGIGMADVIDALTESLDSNSLTNTVNRMKEGDKLKVTTSFYEWSSGSGNHYTYYSENTYTIV